MLDLEALFAPRKRTARVESLKKSTVQTRDYEYKREGLSAGKLKIQSKWRGRKRYAIQRLKESSDYKELSKLDTSRCKQYVDELERKFSELRDSELRRITMIWCELCNKG
jgi:hypothetical protein